MRYFACVALLLVAAPAHADRYLSAIAIAIATDNAAPAPEPSPTGECDNCNGTGKLGDGTIFVPCPVCGGDGIKGVPAVARSAAKPAEHLTLRSEGQPAKSTPVRRGYPVRGSWWTGCPNWTHLTRGEHAGKFDSAWLQTLSNAEIQSLHSDAHEGRVKSAYVVRPAGSVQSVTRSSSGCPGGVCPSPSRGFRLFRR